MATGTQTQASIKFSYPPNYKPYTGATDESVEIFFVDLDAQVALQPQLAGPPDVRVTYASQLLGGAAKVWYANVFVKQTDVTNKTFDEFKKQLRAQFSRGDENVVSRRQQQALRITPLEPRNMITSVNAFNAKYIELQGHIIGQGTQDAVLQFMECVRQSIPAYPDVLQLQQRISIALSAIPVEQRTLSKAQELAATFAPDVIETASPGKVVNTHSMVTLQPMQVSNSYGPIRRQSLNERQRQVLDARQNGYCTYCCDPNADHRSVRKQNPVTQRYTGDIVCGKLLKDIADGKAEERPQRYRGNRNHNNDSNNLQMHLNSSGSRTVTVPAANRA
jgi:hypothetical protein